MDRRDFFKVSSALAIAGALQKQQLFGQGSSVDMSTFNNQFSISAAPSHCNQSHDHYTCPWPGDWVSGDYKAFLQWSRGDSGFNEGAQAAVQLLNAATIQLPAIIATAGGAAVGNVWKRVDMMNFAHYLATVGGNISAGTGLAILSQWHNCHCFRCLYYNAPAVALYMVQWP
ncbi:MAG TPA: hypothetical protein VKU42_00680 [Candidatus Angelobacter sp.]|nr:hypothetical protein [Candidatus Angelobacter sp.]